MLEIGKEYFTLSGQRITIFDYISGSKYPFYGYINGNKNHLISYTETGEFINNPNTSRNTSDIISHADGSPLK